MVVRATVNRLFDAHCNIGYTDVHVQVCVRACTCVCLPKLMVSNEVANCLNNFWPEPSFIEPPV